jgi:predicted cupin superfamily sugar epimerase
MTPAEIKELLRLEPHPVEGGWFRQTYRSAAEFVAPQGRRSAGTAIYYLLEPGTFSEMHILPSDEVFHFYLGDPVEMLQLKPDGSAEVFVLGKDVADGQHVQLLVPGGVWQGTRLLPGGRFALLGCTVSPGFDYADYTSGKFEELAGKWQKQAERIRALTRQ